MNEVRLLNLTSPLIALLFIAAYAFIGTRWKNLHYFLWLAASIFFYALGSALQILRLPLDTGLNSAAACLLYALAASFLTFACFLRLQIRHRHLLTAVFPALMVAAAFYFIYVDRNLQARIYIMNFGIGIQFLLAGLRIRSVARKTIDRVLGWVLICFGAEHFPRTLFTIGHMSKGSTLSMLVETPFWAWLNLSVLFFLVLLGITLISAAASDIIDDLRQRSVTDPLTGLMNRRGFEEFARSQIALPNRLPLSLILCDIDNFKSINDSFGHGSGDAVLARIATLLRRSIRESDAAGRFGGEEFLLLFTNLDRTEAHSVAERLRQEIERTQFHESGLYGRTVTASFGIVEYVPGEGLDSFIRRADAMLYSAKRGGRNRALAEESGVEHALSPDVL